MWYPLSVESLMCGVPYVWCPLSVVSPMCGVPYVWCPLVWSWLWTVGCWWGGAARAGGQWGRRRQLSGDSETKRTCEHQRQRHHVLRHVLRLVLRHPYHRPHLPRLRHQVAVSNISYSVLKSQFCLSFSGGETQNANKHLKFYFSSLSWFNFELWEETFGKSFSYLFIVF